MMDISENHLESWAIVNQNHFKRRNTRQNISIEFSHPFTIHQIINTLVIVEEQWTKLEHEPTHPTISFSQIILFSAGFVLKTDSRPIQSPLSTVPFCQNPSQRSCASFSVNINHNTEALTFYHISPLSTMISTRLPSENNV